MIRVDDIAAGDSCAFFRVREVHSLPHLSNVLGPVDLFTRNRHPAQIDNELALVNTARQSLTTIKVAQQDLHLTPPLTKTVPSVQAGQDGLEAGRGGKTPSGSSISCQDLGWLWLGYRTLA